jgi:predicted DNA-binding protein
MPEAEPTMRTMAIRVEEEFHAQFTALADLQGTTLVAEMRKALEAHLERMRKDGDLGAKAQARRAAIQRQAELEMQAVDQLLGAVGERPGVARTASSATSGKKSGGTASA